MNNILIVFPTLIKGGAEKLVISIFNKIAKDSNNHVYLLSIDGVFDLNEKLSDNITQIRTNFSPKRKILLNIFQSYITIPSKIKKIIRKAKINIVISGYEYDAEQYLLFLPFLLFPDRIKLISLILTDLAPKVLDANLKRRITYKLVDFLREKVFDRIILCSESMINNISIINRDKYCVIRNTIDKNAINEKLNNDLPRMYLEIIEKGPYFISISRYSKQKNLILLLQAFNMIKTLCVYNLIIIGHKSSKEEYNKLELFVNNNDLQSRVFLLEAIENPFPLIKKAKAVVSTSKYEGFSLAILEAMYLKVPIISTKYSCYNDVLNESNSFLCQDFTPKSFAEMLFRFASEDLDVNSKITNAYNFILTDDLMHSVIKYQEILKSI